MNKRLSITILSCLLTASLFCQSRVSVASLYNNFANEKNVEKVNVSGLLTFFAKPFIEKEIKGCKISSVNVMSLDDCSSETKNRFNKMAENFKDDNYELFLKSNEKDEKTRIFVRMQNETIREMVVLTMGKEPALIRIKGKIRPDQVQNMMNQNKR